MTQPGTVSLAVKDGIATISVADEKRMNLLNTASVERLIAVGEELKRNGAVRLVIFSGEGGKAFLGGVDIGEMVDFTPAEALVFISKLHQVCHMLRALPVPSIARIDGYCLGGGLEVAACCDLRIASEGSMFGMPEVQVGLPSVIEAAVLPSLIGWGKTRELLYTGSLIDAAEALRIGFLQKVAPPGGLEAAMAPWIEAILAADEAAIRAQKRLIEGWLDNSGVAPGVQAGIDAFSAAFLGDGPKKRLRAFLDRPRKG